MLKMTLNKITNKQTNQQTNKPSMLILPSPFLSAKVISLSKFLSEFNTSFDSRNLCKGEKRECLIDEVSIGVPFYFDYV